MENSFKILSVQDEVATIQLDMPLENLEKIQAYSKDVNLNVDNILNNEIGSFIYNLPLGTKEKTKEKWKPEKGGFGL